MVVDCLLRAIHLAVIEADGADVRGRVALHRIEKFEVTFPLFARILIMCVVWVIELCNIIIFLLDCVVSIWHWLGDLTRILGVDHIRITAIFFVLVRDVRQVYVQGTLHWLMMLLLLQRIVSCVGKAVRLVWVIKVFGSLLDDIFILDHIVDCSHYFLRSLRSTLSILAMLRIRFHHLLWRFARFHHFYARFNCSFAYLLSLDIGVLHHIAVIVCAGQCRIVVFVQIILIVAFYLLSDVLLVHVLLNVEEALIVGASLRINSTQSMRWLVRDKAELLHGQVCRLQSWIYHFPLPVLIVHQLRQYFPSLLLIFLRYMRWCWVTWSLRSHIVILLSRYFGLVDLALVHIESVAIVRIVAWLERILLLNCIWFFVYSILLWFVADAIHLCRTGTFELRNVDDLVQETIAWRMWVAEYGVRRKLLLDVEVLLAALLIVATENRKLDLLCLDVLLFAALHVQIFEDF